MKALSPDKHLCITAKLITTKRITTKIKESKEFVAFHQLVWLLRMHLQTSVRKQLASLELGGMCGSGLCGPGSGGVVTSYCPWPHKSSSKQETSLPLGGGPPFFALRKLPASPVVLLGLIS